MEYEEHEKRAWSVDFSRTEPSMLVSGSDDCKVFLKNKNPAELYWFFSLYFLLTFVYLIFASLLCCLFLSDY
jgi:hypothetical protein